MLLKRDGPQEAAQLAAQFGLTDMAVRQHLYDLEKQGDICYCSVPRPKGRPAKLWQLTEQANVHFPNTHAEFSTGLILSIHEVFGEQGMEKLLDVRFENQVAEYGGQIYPSAPLKDKLAALVAIRSREGYMAEIIQNEDGYLLVENNCPICEAAKSCSGICARELDLFKTVLGKDVGVKRTEHIIRGARRCAYEISQD
jgi:predicted ArsR family transcriptional regulator